jgi:hypothetical protein
MPFERMERQLGCSATADHVAIEELDGCCPRSKMGDSSCQPLRAICVNFGTSPLYLLYFHGLNSPDPSPN